jgi:two-component system NarL family sensor kinase
MSTDRQAHSRDQQTQRIYRPGRSSRERPAHLELAPEQLTGDVAAQLLRRNHELGVLNAIASALNRAVDAHEAVREALSMVAELLGLRSGWVWLLDERSEPYLAAALDLPPFLANDPQRMTGRCYCLDTFLAGDMSGAAYNVNVIQCSRLKRAYGHPEEDSARGLRYHASIPLYARDKPLGVMNVASSDWRSLEPAELQLLYTIGDQVGLAVERAQLSAAAARLAAAEERNRLAREIHDTLAQSFAAIALHLETADALISVAPERAAESILRALGLARAGMEEARRSVLDLRAAPLHERTLPMALSELARQLHDETGIEVHYHVPAGLDHLPPRSEAGLYRIAQEALTNVRRHAAAQRVAVSLERHGDTIVLVVQDDGQGFDPAIVQKLDGTHFGLAGMQERARLMGGSCTIISTPGQGTRLEVRVPYQ